mmetsp:Transcript_68514/g.132299  ORF Transcript_68514/g.132299 Transcript_68514/m.132299 type:complete len:210 (-) Transcript_68514:174-803(-)
MRNWVKGCLVVKVMKAKAWRRSLRMPAWNLTGRKTWMTKSPRTASHPPSDLVGRRPQRHQPKRRRSRNNHLRTAARLKMQNLVCSNPNRTQHQRGRRTSSSSDRSSSRRSNSNWSSSHNTLQWQSCSSLFRWRCSNKTRLRICPIQRRCSSKASLRTCPSSRNSANLVNQRRRARQANLCPNSRHCNGNATAAWLIALAAAAITSAAGR